MMTKTGDKLIILMLLAAIVWGIWAYEKPAQLPDDYQAGMRKIALHTRDVPMHIRVEIAQKPAARARGMMYRENWGDIQGMLFIFPGPTQSGFWMKNTLLPLDMIFIGKDGKVVHVHRNAEPFSTKTIAPPRPYIQVLELPAGHAELYDVEIGERIDDAQNQ